MKNKLKLLSMTCFLLPIITVVVSYIFSIKLNLVTACIPNFEGCTSISRVGRYEPVKFFFKPMMYLYCLILAYYWYNYFLKLKSFKIETKFIFLLSILSVFFLSLYVTFLGESEIYSFFKRVGIYIYILFIVLTQFLESRLLIKNKEKIKNLFFLNFIKIKYYLSLFLVICGIILLPILIIKIDNFPGIKNIISWNYFFLVQFYFYLVFLSINKIK